MSRTNTINAATLHQWREAAQSMALFDVREPMEADRGHIPGATNLPRRRIELRIATLVRDPDTAIVVTDDDTGRATLAAETLAALGYRNVQWLCGGIEAWRAAGYPVATGNNVPSKLYGEVAYHRYDIPDVDADSFRQWQDEGRDILLFDVRTPEEYREACIPGSTSGPSFDIARHAGDLRTHDGPVVVHCAGRTRSLIAAQTLRELGVTQAVALRNGTMGWLLAGKEVERGARRTLGTPSAASVAHAAETSRTLADAAGIASVDTATLAAWLEDSGNLYVFDVRQRDDHVAGHVPGAQWVPGGQIVQRADDFIAVRDARVVLIDDDETRARLSAVWLHRMGFTQVGVLAGGMAAWQDAGHTLATRRARQQPAGWAAARDAVRRVTPAEAHDMSRQSDRLHILHVGTSAHYCSGHVGGATWLPRSWLEHLVAQVIPDPAMPVLVTCGSGVHAVYAARTLQQLGYGTVAALEGGTAAWQQAGYTLETATMPPQDDILLPPYKRGEQAMRDYLSWEIELAAAHPHG